MFKFCVCQIKLKQFIDNKKVLTLRRVLTRQRMADVAAFLSPTKELDTIPVPRLIITDSGVHWIPLTLENGGTAVSVAARLKI